GLVTSRTGDPALHLSSHPAVATALQPRIERNVTVRHHRVNRKAAFTGLQAGAVLQSSPGMIFLLDEFSDNPQALLAYLAAFLVAIYTAVAFHEFCHAWSAHELGDDTAARQGRLTLNPFVHLEPFWL